MNKLNHTLRSARALRCLSLRDVQKLSDNTITSTYVLQIEQGKAVPAPKKLRVLARIYKLDYLELMVMAGHVALSDLDNARAVDDSQESGAV